MGYAKILWIYEDGIRHPSDDLSERVGDAVLNVCTRGAKSAPVGNHNNCVNLAGEAHSTDTQVYLWVGNCLRPTYQLDDGRIELTAELIREIKHAKEQEQKPAAAKFWQMLTSRIDDVSPFGQRLLFHLPRSPISAFRWGMIGGPCTLPKLREAILDSRRVDALDFLYSYVADYKRTIASLGPSQAENASHLVELAKIILDIKASGSLADSEQSQLHSIAKMLSGLFLDADFKVYAEAKSLSDWANDN
jgi:hypothetical protein